MFNDTPAFSGFSVNDQAAAKAFYEGKLGIRVDEDAMGLRLLIAGGNPIFVYTKPDHTPASFTILNFPVDDIDEAVSALKVKGIQFENYEGMTDENGIARGIAVNRGPDIAWFKDPAGNILSVLQS
jgi:catechol 2,3-dioxygenase-like lactoylglutathione lyase family enzyme